MKQYEDDLYNHWLEKVEANLPNLLKRTVLSKPPSTPGVHSSVHTPISGDTSHAGSRPATVMDFSHIIPPGTYVQSVYTFLSKRFVHLYCEMQLLLLTVSLW